ncbi:MAG: hypothetical protein FJW14_00905 [Acidimicrobiia bacterium]|nr:hypothetical protein [Acidimicrobiia bacterium]
MAAVGSAACSGSALETSPLAPSAVPSATLSAESGAEDAATFGALGGDKGKDKGRDGKGKDGTTTTTPTAGGTIVEAEGVVATATGTCPAKTFTIGTHAITTSATTKYEEGVCADLVALAEIKVRAERQTDNTLVATKVEFKDTDDGEDDDMDDDDGDDEDRRGNPHHGAGPHSGTVSSFRGACPNVTFNLKGLRISTTADTTYEGGTCETLRPNVKVTVTGAAGTGARTFVAARITIDRTPNVRTR